MSGDSNVDNSSGDTVVKVIGRGARVEITGNVTQTISVETAESVRPLLMELRALVADTPAPPNPGPRTEAIQALDDAVEETQQPAPKANRISAAWRKAHSWLASLVAAGSAAVSIAEKANKLVEKLENIFSSPS
jgi:uncharacterized membrane protein YccC